MIRHDAIDTFQFRQSSERSQGASENGCEIEPQHSASSARADEVAELIWRTQGYRTQRYWCHDLPVDKLPQILCTKHIIHAARIHQGNGSILVVREEHWRLHHLPEDEVKVPAYFWEIIDLLKSHSLEPFWLWIAERLPVDNQPIIDPRPLFCIGFENHVVAI